MGTYWYAQSDELIDIRGALEEADRRIFALAASEREVHSAVDERDLLFQRESAARAALKQLGRSVTLDQVRAWPTQILPHIEALGSAEPSRSFLDLLGWSTDYYAENLQSAGVWTDQFSHSLRSIDLSAPQACSLGLEVLLYVDSLESERLSPSSNVVNEVRHARDAGLWLWFWGWVGCRVFAGD